MPGAVPEKDGASWPALRSCAPASRPLPAPRGLTPRSPSPFGRGGAYGHPLGVRPRRCRAGLRGLPRSETGHRSPSPDRERGPGGGDSRPRRLMPRQRGFKAPRLESPVQSRLESRARPSTACLSTPFLGRAWASAQDPCATPHAMQSFHERRRASAVCGARSCSRVTGGSSPAGRPRVVGVITPYHLRLRRRLLELYTSI
jgi:hypothetical protein